MIDFRGSNDSLLVEIPEEDEKEGNKKVKEGDEEEEKKGGLLRRKEDCKTKMKIKISDEHDKTLYEQEYSKEDEDESSVGSPGQPLVLESSTTITDYSTYGTYVNGTRL